MFIGIDVGTVRVGVAVSDDTATLAVPYGTIGWADAQIGWNQLADLVEERNPDGIVVGLPKLMNGNEGSAADHARLFAAHIEETFGLPVKLWDERLTTVEAERMLHFMGMKSKDQRKRIDAHAATIMLQSWLDWRQLHRA